MGHYCYLSIEEREKLLILYTKGFNIRTMYVGVFDTVEQRVWTGIEVQPESLHVIGETERYKGTQGM